jgi:phosphoribosyl 1,2-cyclic phosphate phosphodiesterase
MSVQSFKMTLLGTGTSQGVPVIACECPVCVSADPRDKRLRSAALLSCNGKNIAFDIGPDFRQQMLNSKTRALSAIFITHEHNDHVVGLDEVRPFNFITRKPIHVFAEPRVAQELRKRFAYIFTENPYPGAPQVYLKEIEAGKTYTVEGVPVEAIRINHGNLPILGFKVGNTAYCTDTKTLPEETLGKLEGIDNLIINALHHREHHSHLNLAEAVELSRKINPRHTWFTHISHHMGKYEEVAAHMPSGISIGFDGMIIEGHFRS